MPRNQEPVVRFDSVSYSQNQIPLLSEVSFSLEPGSSTVVLGPNGSGKTTILRILFGLFPPSSGEVWLWGQKVGETPLSPLQKKMGLVQSSLQTNLLQRNLTVSEIVITGFHQTLGLYREITEEERLLARKILDVLEMERLENHLYSTLSSGEKSKVLLLRALGMGKELLVLDEPTENLDFKARFSYFETVTHLKQVQPHLTRVVVTHRLEEIPVDFGNAIFVKEGKILASGNKAELFREDLLSELYGIPVSLTEAEGTYFMTPKKSRGKSSLWVEKI